MVVEKKIKKKYWLKKNNNENINDIKKITQKENNNKIKINLINIKKLEKNYFSYG